MPTSTIVFPKAEVTAIQAEFVPLAVHPSWRGCIQGDMQTLSDLLRRASTQQWQDSDWKAYQRDSFMRPQCVKLVSAMRKLLNRLQEGGQSFPAPKQWTYGSRLKMYAAAVKLQSLLEELIRGAPYEVRRKECGALGTERSVLSLRAQMSLTANLIHICKLVEHPTTRQVIATLEAHGNPIVRKLAIEMCVERLRWQRLNGDEQWLFLNKTGALIEVLDSTQLGGSAANFHLAKACATIQSLRPPREQVSTGWKAPRGDRNLQLTSSLSVFTVSNSNQPVAKSYVR